MKKQEDAVETEDPAGTRGRHGREPWTAGRQGRWPMQEGLFFHRTGVFFSILIRSLFEYSGREVDDGAFRA